MTVPNKIETWQMTVPGKLTRVSIDVPEIKSGEVMVEIAGCGICHRTWGIFTMVCPRLPNRR